MYDKQNEFDISGKIIMDQKIIRPIFLHKHVKKSETYLFLTFAPSVESQWSKYL